MKKIDYSLSRRLIALLLCVAMLLPSLLMQGFAAEATADSTEESVTVIALSDYQNSSGTNTKDTVNYTFSAISSRGISPYGILFCGDYTQYGQDYYKNPTTANMAKDKANIAAGISELNSLAAYRFKGVQQRIFVQGNHDRIAGTAEGLSTSGAHDTDFYGVYVLNNNDYGWKQSNASDMCYGDPAKIQQTAASMKAYFDAKIEDSYDKPIFVAAHIPLHSSYRTREHGENVYAKYIFDVINEAGKSLNIIYLFGHNHSASSDSYIGGGSAYLGRGETIFIPQPGKKDATPTQETLNFTYMNAGYVGYVRNENAGGNELTVSVFEITGNKVEVKRYTRNGITNVRAAGGLYTGAKETAATYGMTTADFNEYMNPSYKTATITAPSVVSDGAINGQWVEIPSYTATAYYQTFQFVEDGVYLIANYGDGTGTWSALQETSAGNVSSTAVTIQKNERGYFITLPDASTANQKEWTFDGFCVNKFATVGSLKNGYTKRYLQADEGGTQGLSLQVVSGNPATTLRTTSARDTNLTDKKFWVYDSTARTADKGHKGLYSGLAVFVGGTDVAANTRNYVLRKDNEDRWAYREDTGPTGQCGPTYIYAKVTDHYDPANSSYAMATIEDHVDFYLGQFASQAEMKDFIRSNLLNVSLMDVNGNVSTISNYVLSTTADPNAEGEYTATVSYKGHVLATLEIHISKANVTEMEIIPAEGVVFQNAKSTEKTGSVLKITYDNGSVVEVPITVGMLKTSGNKAVTTKNIGTQTNLKVVYGDVTVDGYSLRVIDKNYPEYPNPGSVKVEKEGTGVEFDKTGAANVELSATGVPLVGGLDVIVMVDTSSSMSAGNTEDGVQRHIATYNAINQLITTLQGDVKDGILGETKIAVADFNAYKKATAGKDYDNQPWGYYALDGNCWVRDPENNPNNSGLHYSTNTSHTHGARTGVTDPLNLTEAAFVNVMDLSPTWASSQTLPLQSGTNYDFAFDAIYQLGHNIQEFNRKNGRDDRELVVIFLSDGCPFQYNYWMSHANNVNWNDWLNGTLDNDGLNELTGNVGTFKHFYNSNEGRHWMAEAIKGSPDEYYKVIRKSDTGLEGVIRNLNTTDASNKQYMGELPGLGAQMYTIALGITDGDANIKYETIIGVLERIASKPENFYNVNSGEKLVNAFSSIAGTVAQAATQSYFLDTMGKNYDLYMSNQIICSNGNVLEGVVPAIQVRDYAVNNYITSDTPKAVLEEITFKENYLNVPEGTDMVVYQKLLNADGTYTQNTINMKMGELLEGEYVYYNTSKTTSHTVTYFGKTITVKPETFFYITTTLTEDVEFALNYYVYLEDALDNDQNNIAVDAGTYLTNKSAKLYYKNYLGNNCTKDTVSPKFDWGEAKVNYRFYLVNDLGKPIDENGQVITYTNKTFVDSVTVLGDTGSYTFDLNTQSPLIQSGKLAIPEGYALYEYNGGEGVGYTVKPVSGGGIGGSWEITGDDSATQTTFVQNYRPDYPKYISTALEYENKKYSYYDFNNTTVWIALVKLPEILPDTVVVDFGLPIDIHVLANDKLGDTAELIALGTVPADMASTHALRSGFKASYVSTLGAAEIKDKAVIYTPANMQMENADVFAYAVKQTTGETVTYYYGTITVVPATSIYYEDDFVEFTGTWNTAGEYQGGNQGEDRPGEFEFPDYDTDNIYGYDPAYDNSTTYSLGSARYAHVSSKTFETDGAWPTAQFTFTGTGFDLISLTSNQTGFITCRVYQGKQTDTILESWVVDTYYGYERAVDKNYPWVKYTYTYHADEDRWTASKIAVKDKLNDETTVLPTDPKDGEQVIQYRVNYIWTATDGENDLYQIPVIKSPELPYGTYTVIVTPTYIPFFDHTGAGGYDFYLDAIRIYSPAQNMEDYYVQDGEAWPQYVELRQQLLSVDASGNATGYVNGISFIDGVAANGEIADYEAYGPNNEIYLNSNQAVAFAIDSKGEMIANVHVGMKIFDGAGTLNVSSVDATGKTLADWDISSASHTDLYYSITDAYVPVSGKNVSNVIVLTNTGSKPITLTTLKITYEQQPTEDSQLVMNLENMQAASKHVTRKIAPLVVETPVDEALVFTRHSLSLQSSIAMHYQVENSILEGYDYCYVEFERYDYGTGALVTESAEAEAYEGVMLFAYLLDSYQMTDLVSATLYGVKDGVTYKGETLENSIEQYILSRLPQTSDAKLLRLYADLLTYGAMAQIHMDYRTDVLANASLGEYAAYVTADDPTADNYSAETAYGYSGAVLKQMALGIASEIQLQTIITLDGYKAEEVYGVMTLVRDGQTVTQRVEGTDFETVNGYYVIIFDTLTAIDGRTPVEVTVYNAEGQPISETWTYSISTYYSIRNTGVAGQTMRALLNYLDAAEAYFGQ